MEGFPAFSKGLEWEEDVEIAWALILAQLSISCVSCLCFLPTLHSPSTSLCLISFGNGVMERFNPQG